MFWIVLFFLVAAGALIQGASLLRLAGTNPNIVLVFLMVLACVVKNWNVRIVIMLVAFLTLALGAGFAVELLFLVFTVFLAWFLLDRLSSQAWINIIVVILLSTLVFNALINLLEWNWFLGVVAKEMIYNTILGVIMFVLINYVAKKKTRAIFRGGTFG